MSKQSARIALYLYLGYPIIISCNAPWLLMYMSRAIDGFALRPIALSHRRTRSTERSALSTVGYKMRNGVTA